MSTLDDTQKYEAMCRNMREGSVQKTRGGSSATISCETSQGFRGAILNNEGDTCSIMVWNNDGTTYDRTLFGYDIVFD